MSLDFDFNKFMSSYGTIAVEGSFKLIDYLFSLPEKDRQKTIDQMKAKHAESAVSVKALLDELQLVKDEHAALKKQIEEQIQKEKELALENVRHLASAAVDAYTAHPEPPEEK